MSADEPAPTTVVATVIFQAYEDVFDSTIFVYKTMNLQSRLKQCIETHPTLSFRVDEVHIQIKEEPNRVPWELRCSNDHRWKIFAKKNTVPRYAIKCTKCEGTAIDMRLIS